VQQLHSSIFGQLSPWSESSLASYAELVPADSSYSPSSSASSARSYLRRREPQLQERYSVVFLIVVILRLALGIESADSRTPTADPHDF